MKVVNLNEMFGITEEEKKQDNGSLEIKTNEEVYIKDLIPFKNHPFKLYTGDRLDDMVDSIREYGIITPLIVRPIEDNKYEILSGHNRANAGKLAGLEKAPVVIKDDLTDEEAMLIITETNLIQRSFSELSHSEKARIITERHNAIKDQGKRTDLIKEIETMSNTDDFNANSSSYQFDKKMESNERLGETYDLSPANISRYLRIDKLIDELKIRLDNNEIPFTAGVNLSFINEEGQRIVEDVIETYGYKMNLKKSEILKTFAKNRELKHNRVVEVLSGKYFEKPKPQKKLKFTPKFTKSLISKYFDEDTTQKEMEKVVERALEEYYNKLESEDIKEE